MVIRSHEVPKSLSGVQVPEYLYIYLYLEVSLSIDSLERDGVALSLRLLVKDAGGAPIA